MGVPAVSKQVWALSFCTPPFSIISCTGPAVERVFVWIKAPFPSPTTQLSMTVETILNPPFPWQSCSPRNWIWVSKIFSLTSRHWFLWGCNMFYYNPLSSDCYSHTMIEWCCGGTNTHTTKPLYTLPCAQKLSSDFPFRHQIAGKSLITHRVVSFPHTAITMMGLDASKHHLDKIKILSCFNCKPWQSQKSHIKCALIKMWLFCNI